MLYSYYVHFFVCVCYGGSHCADSCFTSLGKSCINLNGLVFILVSLLSYFAIFLYILPYQFLVINITLLSQSQVFNGWIVLFSVAIILLFLVQIFVHLRLIFGSLLSDSMILKVSEILQASQDRRYRIAAFLYTPLCQLLAPHVANGQFVSGATGLLYIIIPLQLCFEFDQLHGYNNNKTQSRMSSL